MGRNCYTKDDVEKFREAVVKYLVPVADKVYRCLLYTSALGGKDRDDEHGERAACAALGVGRPAHRGKGEEHHRGLSLIHI